MLARAILLHMLSSPQRLTMPHKAPYSWSGTPAYPTSDPPKNYLNPDLPYLKGFPCGSAGKESACDAEDLGLIPGWEDPLEKGKATYSSVLAWRISWTVYLWGHKESDMMRRLSLSPYLKFSSLPGKCCHFI